MSDRMTLDPGLLPHLERQLGAQSEEAHRAGASVRALATWASGADPALASAAQTLARASQALSDTSKQLDATRRDVSRRASLLELEGKGGSGRALSGAQRGDMDAGRRQSDADSDDDPQDGLSYLWLYSVFGLRDSALDFGLGLLHAEMGDTDSSKVEKGSRIDILSASGKIGQTNSETDRWGLAGSAQLMGLSWMLGHNSLGLRSIEANAGRVQAEASVGKDGATLGASASLGDVAATWGRPSKDSGTDTQVRFGAGLGGGAAGRLHWSDDDSDGDREYGFGLDLRLVAGVSFDVKTEAVDDAVNLVLGGGDVQRRLEGGPKPQVS